MKKKRQTNIMESNGSKPRTNLRRSLVLATLAGVALVAVGCSTDRHAPAEYSSTTTYSTPAPPPAAGAAASPGAQSSGYVTGGTITTTYDQRTDVITDPRELPRDNINAEFVGRPINFTHMRVQRVDSDGFFEVTSDDGTTFYVMGYANAYNVKPGDIVVLTGTLVDSDTNSTGFVKKTGYYMTRHPYYIWVDRIQVVPA